MASVLFLLFAALPQSLIGQTWNEVIKVVASDRAAGDGLGYSVSISGDYAIVGATGDDEDASGANTMSSAGSAYIFVRVGSTWTQQQKVVASDRAAGDLFGHSVAIHGDCVVVGASRGDVDAAGGNAVSNAGAAYIFVRNGTEWTQQQKVVAGDRGVNDYFGQTVAIHGDHAVVGAWAEDHDATGGSMASAAGSAYIFVRNGTVWTQQQKIVASDRAANDSFGYGVAIDGSSVIVGASGEDEDASGVNTLTEAGSAYIFSLNGTVWTQQQKIVSNTRAAYDSFGYSVAIDGDYIIASGHFNSLDASGGNYLNGAGAAYIFQRSGGSWVQQQKIVAGDRAASDNFGYCVAISGKYAVVGSYFEDEDALGGNTAEDAGSAYLFERTGSTWIQVQKIAASDRAAGDAFGQVVSISGEHAFVGAWLEDQDALGGNTMANAGSAYFFAVPSVALSVKACLAGPYNAADQLMNDALRTLPSFPIAEPFTTMGFINAGGGGGETTNAGVLAATGTNAIVDWVRLELRDGSAPGLIVATHHGLVQRDGDIVSEDDGVSPVRFNVVPGNYHVAVLHRDHLGCMTALPVALSSATTSIDFTNPATLTWGTNAQNNVNGTMALWPGDATFDGTVRYVGTSNDRDPILTAIGGSTPTNVVNNVYSPLDVNMDGSIRYVGANNDRDIILQTVGGSVPTAIRIQQVP